MKERRRDERLQIMLTKDELNALNDWRFARKMPSRAAAVRELLRRGMTVYGGERHISEGISAVGASGMRH